MISRGIISRFVAEETAGLSHLAAWDVRRTAAGSPPSYCLLLRHFRRTGLHLVIRVVSYPRPTRPTARALDCPQGTDPSLGYNTCNGEGTDRGRLLELRVPKHPNSNIQTVTSKQ